MKTLLWTLVPALVLLGCSVPSTPSPDLRSGELFRMREFDRVLGAQEQQTQSEVPRTRKGETAVPVGAGFTLDPDTAFLNIAWDVQLNPIMSMGTSFLFGGSNERFLFAPTFQIKTYLNADETAEPSRFQPYLQGGLGWAWLDSDRTADGSDFDSNSFLINGGGGIRYRLSQHYSIGTGALINFVPSKLDDDRWFFSWEVLQLVFHF